MTRTPLRMALLTLAVLTAADATPAANIYVDNRLGEDTFDGSTRRPQSAGIGPVRTIRRALQLADTADTIHLANNDTPYYESVQLFGGQHSGTPNQKFVLDGHGAVISGAGPVPEGAWQQVATGLWKITPWRKGYYQLLLDEEPVPEFQGSLQSDRMEKLPEGEWTARHGSIYYRSAPTQPPTGQPFRFAARSVGLTLYRVHHVAIRNVTVRHFRLDGINVPDFCRDINLVRVGCLQNGRAGLAVGGTGRVTVRKGELVQNRVADLLITELGRAEVIETRVPVPKVID